MEWTEKCCNDLKLIDNVTSAKCYYDDGSKRNAFTIGHVIPRFGKIVNVIESTIPYDLQIGNGYDSRLVIGDDGRYQTIFWIEKIKYI